jgi:hypothetical protein
MPCRAKRRNDSPYGSSDRGFLMPSAYIAYDSLDALLRRNAPARRLPGIVIAAASLIAMPLLSRAKKDASVSDWVARRWLWTHGRPTSARIFQRSYLAACSSTRSIIAREGIAGWQGKACCDTCVD